MRPLPHNVSSIAELNDITKYPQCKEKKGKMLKNIVKYAVLGYNFGYGKG